MKWYLIRETNSDVWADIMKAKNEADAARELIEEYRSIKKFNRLYAIHADEDEDGCIDYETADNTIETHESKLYLHNTTPESRYNYSYSTDDLDVIFEDEDTLIDGISWDEIVSKMDDNTRELVHAAYAPCSNKEFLRNYLLLADDDIYIG